MVDNIIENRHNLYAANKDFSYNLNHNSNSLPVSSLITSLLRARGTINQFDIAFLADFEPPGEELLLLFASLDVICIFKEAMTNVIRPACATEVALIMTTAKVLVITF